MNYSKIIKYLAKQNGIDEVDFLKDVILQDEGSGVYIKHWGLGFKQPSLIEMEAVETVSNDDFLSEKIRKERNVLLTDSDWVIIRGTEPDSTISQEWKDYRIELRNLPEHPNFPNVTFPEKPSN